MHFVHEHIIHEHVQEQIINMYMINTGTSEHAHKQELEYEHICEQVQHEHMLYCTVYMIYGNWSPHSYRVVLRQIISLEFQTPRHVSC